MAITSFPPNTAIASSGLPPPHHPAIGIEDDEDAERGASECGNFSFPHDELMGIWSDAH